MQSRVYSRGPVSSFGVTKEGAAALSACEDAARARDSKHKHERGRERERRGRCLAPLQQRCSWCERGRVSVLWLSFHVESPRREWKERDAQRWEGAMRCLRGSVFFYFIFFFFKALTQLYLLFETELQPLRHQSISRMLIGSYLQNWITTRQTTAFFFFPTSQKWRFDDGV